MPESAAVFDLFECAPYNVYSDEDVPTCTFPSYQSLFFESDSNLSYFTSACLGEFSIPVSEEQDEDDSETIIWITPRPKIIKNAKWLEEPDDDFQLDGPASPVDSEVSSASSSSDEDTFSDGHSVDRYTDDEELNLSPTRHELATAGSSEESADARTDNNEDVSDDEEVETLVQALLEHAAQLGHRFVYPAQAANDFHLDTTQSIAEIIRSIRRPSDTYVAAMKLYLKYADEAETQNDSEAEAILRDIQETVFISMMDWLYGEPGENMSLGRAIFALIGQLMRLEIIPTTYVAEIIEGMKGQFHLQGRMQGLQTLFRYAGPLACTKENIASMATVRRACDERPGDDMMQRLYKKMKRDMLVYGCRNSLLGSYRGRLEQQYLRGMLADLGEEHHPPYLPNSWAGFGIQDQSM